MRMRNKAIIPVRDPAGNAVLQPSAWKQTGSLWKQPVKGTFRTIQGAINSLPDSSATPQVSIYPERHLQRELYMQSKMLYWKGR